MMRLCQLFKASRRTHRAVRLAERVRLCAVFAEPVENRVLRQRLRCFFQDFHGVDAFLGVLDFVAFEDGLQRRLHLRPVELALDLRNELRLRSADGIALAGNV